MSFNFISRSSGDFRIDFSTNFETCQIALFPLNWLGNLPMIRKWSRRTDLKSAKKMSRPFQNFNHVNNFHTKSSDWHWNCDVFSNTSQLNCDVLENTSQFFTIAKSSNVWSIIIHRRLCSEPSVMYFTIHHGWYAIHHSWFYFLMDY